MSNSIVSSTFLKYHSLGKKASSRKRIPLCFDMEITSSCNNNCRHCFINIPSNNRKAQESKLSFEEIKNIVNEATSLGAILCLITGGEPLLREDFLDIYLLLKRKGLLVSIFTNVTLITEKHIQLFKKYPPRDIEVTVYGVTKETYEKVSRKPGSFADFRRGLNLLLKNGIKVRLKTMALHSNVHELNKITLFCRKRTKDYFRFDPFLIKSYNRNPVRNEEIRLERLSPKKIVAIERSDQDRFLHLKRNCDKLISKESSHTTCNHLFRCGAGIWNFSLSYNGFFLLCNSLRHPDTIYDLRKGSLSDAWYNFIPRVPEKDF
jgi:MoaA/NifB/PqqE/SkfB family radical SAM enzyme